MKTSNIVVWLACFIVVLALVATGVGLVYRDQGHPFSFTTIRGQTVQVYGQGLYHYDTPIAALAFQGADIVTLFLVVPLLVISILLYRRRSIEGAVLLAGALAYVLYNYASMTFGAAYNNLFLIYLALFSASLFGLLFLFTSIDVEMYRAGLLDNLPRRGISVFLIVTGVILFLVWMMLSILPGLFEGKAPLEVLYYTTGVTWALDMGIVSPVMIISGMLLLRRASIGYWLASVLLVCTVTLGLNLTAGGTLQLLSGAITVGQAMGFTVPFIILTLFSIWFTAALLKSFAVPAAARAMA